MREKKKGKLVLILALIAIVAVAAVSRIYSTMSLPEHEPGDLQLQEHAGETAAEPGKTEKQEVVVSEDMILSIAQEILGDQIAVTDMSAEIGENAGISVTGNVSKADIAKLLETQEGSIAESYQAVLALFPDSLPMELKIRMEASDTGTLNIIPGGVLLGSMEIPDSMLGEDFYDNIANAFQRELQKQITKVETVAVKDGSIIVIGT